MNPDTIAEAIRWAASQLGDDEPQIPEAEILLAHVLDRPRSFLHTWPERSLRDESRQQFSALVEQRRRGVPIAYLTGHRQFWSLDLYVTPDTLIPRPETELLVERTLAVLDDGARTRSVADLGTGSGAIALTLARERPDWRVVGTDLSQAALHVAEKNRQRYELANVELRQGIWCEALAGEKFDAIVSNPPYIAAEDPHLQQGDLRFEPQQALVSGTSGLEAIERIADGARSVLVPGGRLLLEHGYDQASRVAAILQSLGYLQVKSTADLQGHLRVTEGRIGELPPLHLGRQP